MSNDSFFKKLGSFIALLAGVCTILGLSLRDVIPPEVIKDNFFAKWNVDEPKETPQVTSGKKKFNAVQECVNHHVPLCKNAIFSMETWRKLSSKELYYILNGIYAYEGMIFKSNFYDAFDWYDGRISQEEFPEGLLNYYQNKNVANIKQILEERGVR